MEKKKNDVCELPTEEIADKVINFKETLLRPNTNFDMKANLKDKEPLIQAAWESHKIYEKTMMKNIHQTSFFLHDGPPYANGDIHVGHALNKILKDFIVRYKNLQGIYAPIVHGWDTHGLPIEHALLKSDPEAKKLSTVEFRNKCLQYAKTQIEKQKKQFRRLGLFTNWNETYHTFDLSYELAQLDVFKKMVTDGLIFKALKPVYWSPSSQSALAEAEIEYAEKTSASIYVTFEVEESKSSKPGIKKGDLLVIWTTTPWTLPSNLAISVNPLIEYVIVTHGGKRFIVSKKLYEKNLVELFQWKDAKVSDEFLGEELVGVKYIHSMNNKVLPVLGGEHVSEEDGTGLVHTAPGFGMDDYLICKQHDIQPYAPINEFGKFTKDINDPELENIFYEDANKIVSERFKSKDHLLHLSFFKHSYPHDWRTKKPVIYRATAQWFVNIAKLKHEIKNNIDTVAWFPEWAKNRMQLMIGNRVEWCISRQRKWGVCIPIVYANGEPMLQTEVIEYIICLFKQHGTNIWYEKEAKFFVPSKLQKKGVAYTLEKDIMDVWFDSGVSSHAVIKHKYGKVPADLYLEGNDQFRGWFNSSLICSQIIAQVAPYKQVVAHGMVLDEKGNKMSKSIGNVVDPIAICNEYGADVLRLWVALVNYQDDVRIGKDILKQVSEQYRRIRNTIRFLLANLGDFDPTEFRTASFAGYPDEQLFIVARFNELVERVQTNYENYNFHDAMNDILNFCSADLSGFYLDFTKDILYCDSLTSLRRKQVQSIYFYILKNMLKLLSPILPHTVDEAHDSLDILKHSGSSAFASPIKIEDPRLKMSFKKNWIKFSELRDAVYKELEVARQQGLIGRNIDATVTINPKPEFEAVFDYDLLTLLMVSDIKYDDKQTEFITVKKHEGQSCERCFRQQYGLYYKDKICKRCHDAIFLK